MHKHHAPCTNRMHEQHGPYTSRMHEHHAQIPRTNSGRRQQGQATKCNQKEYPKPFHSPPTCPRACCTFPIDMARHRCRHRATNRASSLAVFASYFVFVNVSMPTSGSTKSSYNCSNSISTYLSVNAINLAIHVAARGHLTHGTMSSSSRFRRFGGGRGGGWVPAGVGCSSFASSTCGGSFSFGLLASAGRGYPSGLGLLPSAGVFWLTVASAVRGCAACVSALEWA